MLLSVTWAVTVVRLAASISGTGISYGCQGAVYQSEYLLVLILIAIAVSLLTGGGKWLIVAVALTTWYSLVPDPPSFPSALEISAGPGGVDPHRDGLGG